MARQNTSLILSASKGNLEPKHWNIPHNSNYLQPKQQWVGQHSYKYTESAMKLCTTRFNPDRVHMFKNSTNEFDWLFQVTSRFLSIRDHEQECLAAAINAHPLVQHASTSQ